MHLTSVTITNIRTDALRLGIIGSGGLQTIIANVKARDGFKDVTIKDVNVTLAFLNTGVSLWFHTEPPSPLILPAAEIPRIHESQTDAVSPTFTLHLGEGFPGAFKTRAEEAGISALPTDQVANSGTLLTLSLRGIPEGIAVYAAAKGRRDKIGSPAVRLLEAKRDMLQSAAEPTRPVVTSSSGVELVECVTQIAH